jgi:cytochrome c-type biogenesis protein CcmH
MMLTLIFVGLGALALLFMLLPLVSAAAANDDRDAGAMAVLRDQLAEIERDQARGLISEVEAKDAGIEVKRRMLALSNTPTVQKRASARGGWVLGVAIVVIGVSGVGLYNRFGQPDIPSMPFAERAAEREASAQIVELAEELRSRLVASENGGPHDGWVLLGQTYMRMNNFTGAAEALVVATTLPEATSATFSQAAEAIIASENGIVTPPAQASIDRAVELDPLNPAAVYYQAISLDQTGRTATAYDILVARIRLETEITPWMNFYVARINQIGGRLGRPPVGPMTLLSSEEGAPGPSADQVTAAADMSPEDRAAFVQSMVDRLAARLQDEPDDLEGWLRLANAYRVLGDDDAARNALTQAEPLLPEDGPQRQVYEDMSGDLAE